MSRLALPLFLVAEGSSLFGNAAISIVLPWLVLSRTGDPALTGLVATVSALPSFLATLVSGHLLDKVGRRRMSVLADIGSAVFDVPGMTARGRFPADRLLVGDAGRAGVGRRSDGRAPSDHRCSR